MQKILSIFISCCTLAACGGGNSHTTPNIMQPPTNDMRAEDYQKLTRPEIEPSVLKYATEAELLNHIKNGLRLRVSVFDDTIEELFNQTDDVVTFSAVIADASPTATANFTGNAADGVSPTGAVSDSNVESTSSDLANAPTADGFSETNTHVSGVDEADYVKYDGQYLFISASSSGEYGSLPASTIRIMETNPANAEITEVGTIETNSEAWGSVSELYLVGDENGTNELVTTQSDWNYVSVNFGPEAIFNDYASSVTINEINITSYDVSDPSSAVETFNIAIDGDIQSSRKIGNILYLVTRFTPHFDDIRYYFTQNEQSALEDNEARISSLTLEDALPAVRINGGESQPLLQASDCLIPADSGELHGYSTLITVIAIDLEQHKVLSANCLNTQVGGIYANQNSLYIGGSAYRTWEDYESYTVVHKFNLDSSIDYRSTGIVPGWLGWQDPSFRMDEYEGSFRIVTTGNDGFGPIHRLSILQDNTSSDAMTLVAELPNETQTAAIGKPGEDIYAVRFVGDRGYIVTFERTDPLYVLDLSVANAPVIAGELEVPGFSSYLHPIGENHLLGIGRDADDEGQLNGTKVSLFDIRDISAPELVSSETFGERGSWTSVLNDLRSITFLSPNSDQVRFAVPISLNSEPWVWQEDSLHLFEINGLDASTVSLNFVGKIIAEESNESNTWPSYSSLDRSVLHDDAVYYSHNDEVWASFWSSPNAATGPH